MTRVVLTITALLFAACGSVQERDEDSPAKAEARRLVRAALRAAAVQACRELKPDNEAHPALRLAWVMACGGVMAAADADLADGGGR